MKRFVASRTLLVALLLAFAAIAGQWPRTLGFMCVFALATVIGWFAFRQRHAAAKRGIVGGVNTLDQSYTPIAGDVFGASHHPTYGDGGASGHGYGGDGGGDGSGH
jgi:hypothetical protein